MSDVPEQTCSARATCDTMSLPDKHFLYASDADETDGHPNKLCEQITDTILDACLTKDAEARGACEACTRTGMVMLPRWCHQEGTCKLRADHPGGGEVSWIPQ